jgi:hypothetical protein
LSQRVLIKAKSKTAPKMAEESKNKRKLDIRSGVEFSMGKYESVFGS